jgi:hypothetical protein
MSRFDQDPGAVHDESLDDPQRAGDLSIEQQSTVAELAASAIAANMELLEHIAPKAIEKAAERLASGAYNQRDSLAQAAASQLLSRVPTEKHADILLEGAQPKLTIVSSEVA